MFIHDLNQSCGIVEESEEIAIAPIKQYPYPEFS